MYTLEGIILITALAALLVTVNVFIHYEVLSYLFNLLDKIKKLGRARVAFLMLFLLPLHIIEIWIFAIGIFYAERYGELGHIVGIRNGHILDYVYYSSMTYITVGFGDLYPVGELRFIAAIESLTGLMFITWSASFTYLEMNRYWRKLK